MQIAEASGSAAQGSQQHPAAHHALSDSDASHRVAPSLRTMPAGAYVRHNPACRVYRHSLRCAQLPNLRQLWFFRQGWA